MWGYDIDLRPLVWFGFAICLCIWGCWELIDWLFIDDAIRVTTPLIPEIELVVEDNVVDTIYVYREP
jgi:hypothetical protein